MILFKKNNYTFAAMLSISLAVASSLQYVQASDKLIYCLQAKTRDALWVGIDDGGKPTIMRYQTCQNSKSIPKRSEVDCELGGCFSTYRTSGIQTDAQNPNQKLLVGVARDANHNPFNIRTQFTKTTQPQCSINPSEVIAVLNDENEMVPPLQNADAYNGYKATLITNKLDHPTPQSQPITRNPVSTNTVNEMCCVEILINGEINNAPLPMAEVNPDYEENQVRCRDWRPTQSQGQGQQQQGQQSRGGKGK